MISHLLEQWRSLLISGVASSLLLLVIFRLRRFLRDNLSYILEALLWYIARRLSKSLAARFSMRHYCQNVLAQQSSRYVHVPGIRNMSLDVDRIFVPLSFDQSDGSASDIGLESLPGGSRIVVVGDPGSGKSTLTKYWLREAARHSLSDPRKGRLPIQLELRSLDPPVSMTDDMGAGRWLVDHLRSIVASVAGYEMGQLFDSYVVTNGLLVLLDGLDEVAANKYASVMSALRGLNGTLHGKSSENIIVLTSRVQYYQEIRNDLENDYPQPLFIQPFSPNDIYTFLRQWPFEYSEANAAIVRIYADLTDRPTVREMCSNPLILAMYVLNDQSAQGIDVPETRTEFYRLVVNELLVMRRSRQQLASGRTSLREKREEILGILAYDNLIDKRQAANSIAAGDAIAAGKKAWGCSATEAEIRFRQLANDTGIITEERSSESWRFIHITFCEFLAAIESASGRRFGWYHLLTIHEEYARSAELTLRSRLVEVIPFALALLSRNQRQQSLQEVAKLSDGIILGRCFLETQLYDSPAWNSYLDSELAYLSTPAIANEVEQWVRHLQLLYIVVNDAKGWTKHIAQRPRDPMLEKLFRKIVTSNTQALNYVFAAYAMRDGASAFRLAESFGVDMLATHLKLVLSSCQEESFLEFALHRIDNNSANANKWILVMMEAALRYANVASTLNSLRISRETVLDSSSGLPAAIRGLVAAGSYYEHFILETLHYKLRVPTELEAVRTFTRLRYRRTNTARLLIFAMPMLVLVLFGFPVSYLHGVAKSVTFGVVVALYWCTALVALSLMRSWRALMRVIVNLYSRESRRFHHGLRLRNLFAIGFNPSRSTTLMRLLVVSYPRECSLAASLSALRGSIRSGAGGMSGPSVRAVARSAVLVNTRSTGQRHA